MKIENMFSNHHFLDSQSEQNNAVVQSYAMLVLIDCSSVVTFICPAYDRKEEVLIYLTTEAMNSCNVVLI